MNIRNYESVVIFTPVLSEDQLKEAVGKFRQLITEHKGEIVHEDSWGLTKMAYPIQKKTTGFYHIYEFKASSDIVAALELAFKRDERILRFLTIALDKHGVLYNQRKRNGEFRKEKKEKVEAPVEKVKEILKDEIVEEI